MMPSLAQRLDIGLGIGAPGVGQRAVEVEQYESYTCHQSNDCMLERAILIMRAYSSGVSSMKK